jgi:hypothetical protein
MITDILSGIQTGHLRHKSLERCQNIGFLNEGDTYSDNGQRIVSNVLVSGIKKLCRITAISKSKIYHSYIANSYIKTR